MTIIFDEYIDYDSVSDIPLDKFNIAGVIGDLVVYDGEPNELGCLPDNGKIIRDSTQNSFILPTHDTFYTADGSNDRWFTCIVGVKGTSTNIIYNTIRMGILNNGGASAQFVARIGASTTLYNFKFSYYDASHNITSGSLTGDLSVSINETHRYDVGILNNGTELEVYYDNTLVYSLSGLNFNDYAFNNDSYGRIYMTKADGSELTLHRMLLSEGTERPYQYDSCCDPVPTNSFILKDSLDTYNGTYNGVQDWQKEPLVKVS